MKETIYIYIPMTSKSVTNKVYTHPTSFIFFLPSFELYDNASAFKTPSEW